MSEEKKEHELAKVERVLRDVRDELRDGPRSKELFLTVATLTRLHEEVASFVCLDGRRKAKESRWLKEFIEGGCPAKAGGFVEEEGCHYCSLEIGQQSQTSDHDEDCLWRRVNVTSEREARRQAGSLEEAVAVSEGRRDEYHEVERLRGIIAAGTTEGPMLGWDGGCPYCSAMMFEVACAHDIGCAWQALVDEGSDAAVLDSEAVRLRLLLHRVLGCCTGDLQTYGRTTGLTQAIERELDTKLESVTVTNVETGASIVCQVSEKDDGGQS